jgi:hypothetical protein
MKVRTLLLAVVGAATLALPGTGWAHHSAIAEFDLNNPVTIRGTLTKMEWVNPHAWLYVTAKGPDGKTVDWKIETGSPARMQTRGLKREYFQPGTEVIVGGFTSRNGTQTLAGWVVSFPARETAGKESSFALGR